jgi:hypothetical protein
VDKGGKLGLMACAGLGKNLLELAPRRGEGNPHVIGGSLQTMTAGNGYCRLRFTMGQVESSP